MADNHSKEVRSMNMSHIRSKNSKPEELVRKYLFSKLDIHDWSPDHQRCNNRGTFTREEARTLIKLLKKEV